VPDNNRRIRAKDLKQALLNRVRVLGCIDASLPVASPIGDLLRKVEVDDINKQPNRDELLLISRLPYDRDLMNRTLQLSFGGTDLGEDRLRRINERLQAILDNAIQTGYRDWVIKAGTLAGFPYPVAEHLRNFITVVSSQPNFAPPQDAYNAWVDFLVKWLRTLSPPWITWSLLKHHIKAWRYTRGRRGERDLDIKALLIEAGYPESLAPNLENDLTNIWDNLRTVLRGWVQDNTYLVLAELLKRRPCPENRKSARNDARHYLPTSISWSQNVVDHASRFAGVMLALRDQWVLNDGATIPDWYSQAQALNTFPLGLRSGVSDPAALAWYRHLLRERRIANLLSVLAPIKLNDITSPQAALNYVIQAKELVMEDSAHDQEFPVLIALKQLIREIP